MMDRAGKAIEQWRKERPDITLDAMQLSGRLAEATTLIHQGCLGPFFAEYGLQPGEFDVLATLRRSGKPYTLTPTDLYEAAMISSGSMTNRLNRLQKAGLIERLPNPDDGRSLLVRLSSQGLQRIEEILTPYTRLLDQLLGSLDREESQTLSRLLHKLIATLPAEPGKTCKETSGTARR